MDPGGSIATKATWERSKISWEKGKIKDHLVHCFSWEDISHLSKCSSEKHLLKKDQRSTIHPLSHVSPIQIPPIGRSMMLPLFSLFMSHLIDGYCFPVAGPGVHSSRIVSHLIVRYGNRLIVDRELNTNRSIDNLALGHTKVHFLLFSRWNRETPQIL